MLPDDGDGERQVPDRIDRGLGGVRAHLGVLESNLDEGCFSLS